LKSFYITKYDKTSPLKFGDLPIPDISADQVLVEMHYASLNPIDFKIKHGDLKMVLPMKFPLILGNDGSGIVSKIGKNVKHFKVGDEVYLRPDKNSGIGTLAEFIAVGEDELALKPKNLSLEEAASIPLVGLTVWQIYERAGLKKDRKFSFRQVPVEWEHLQFSGRNIWERKSQQPQVQKVLKCFSISEPIF